MNFFKIKYFPSKIEDYIYFCLSNIVFLLIILALFEQIVKEKKKSDNINEVMLFIPKIGEDFEEKRDLIFNQLSANSSIISLNKLEDKEIRILLSDLLKNIKLSDNILPEVYNVQVEHRKPLNFDLINSKIKKIINGALLKKFRYKNPNIPFLYIFGFIVLITIVLLNNFFLVKNHLLKKKDFINLSRYFGVNDFVIIRNLNISFFILMILVFAISYLIVKLIPVFYFDVGQFDNFLISYLIIYFIYNFIFLFILSLQCKMYMKKLNKL